MELTDAVGSQNALIPQEQPEAASAVVLQPAIGEDSLLRNFVLTNASIFPVQARVVRSSAIVTSEDNNDNNVVNYSNGESNIYYNSLLHHRIQTGSLLVLHCPTRQVKILARSHNDGRCFAIPSTYRGLFLIMRKTFKSLSELLAWQDAADSDPYSVYMTPKSDQVRIVSISNEHAHLLRTGDVVRVKPVSGYSRPVASVAEEPEGIESAENDDRALPGVNASLSEYYRRRGGVELERLRQTGNKSTVVPFNLKATLEEVVEAERKLWTVGQLTPLAQKQKLWVKLVEAGTDHPTMEEDLPLEVPLELAQVIAEPTVWVSDQTPDSPAFHLPARTNVHLRITKNLPKESSPILSNQARKAVSLLDRCVEHLPVPVFQELLMCRYSVDIPLLPHPERNPSRSRSHSSQARPTRKVPRHSIVNAYPTRRWIYETYAPGIYEARSPVLQNEIDSRFSHLMHSASFAGSRHSPPVPPSTKYKVIRMSTSNQRIRQPMNFSPPSNKRQTKQPTVTLTPPTPKINGPPNYHWQGCRPPPRNIYANDENINSSNSLNGYVVYAAVGRADDTDVFDSSSRIGTRDSEPNPSSVSSGEEVFQANDPREVRSRGFPEFGPRGALEVERSGSPLEERMVRSLTLIQTSEGLHGVARGGDVHFNGSELHDGSAGRRAHGRSNVPDGVMAEQDVEDSRRANESAKKGSRSTRDAGDTPGSGGYYYPYHERPRKKKVQTVHDLARAENIRAYDSARAPEPGTSMFLSQGNLRRSRMPEDSCVLPGSHPFLNGYSNTDRTGSAIRHVTVVNTSSPEYDDDDRALQYPEKRGGNFARSADDVGGMSSGGRSYADDQGVLSFEIGLRPQNAS